MLSLTSGNMSPAEVDLLWRTDRPQIGAERHRLARRVSGFHLPAVMIRGRIAIPDVDPKTWRSRGRKGKQTQPAMAPAIVTPAPMKKRRQMKDGQEQPLQSAIVGPKKPRNTML
jgi:hypothetical protein